VADAAMTVSTIGTSTERKKPTITVPPRYLGIFG
jgi:hypothetical protein